MTRHPCPHPRILAAGVSAAAAAILACLTTPTAHADGAEPVVPPGSITKPSPPVEIDGQDPELRLADGAALAPAKVLDIKSVVEDLGGEERREDTNSDVKFALQAEVLFPKDSARLSPDAHDRIRAIADEIKAQDAAKVRVFGFTDDLGSSAHGDVLSKRRANTVHQELTDALGAGVAFEIRGYGEQYPIADNSTESGRKKNRRVEVSFPREDAG
ncbi:OmpA family protein [Streptomyces pathocidini]|uniref:OmpA family protein n=1 Tax=Streptomyces pathocidini TaxID=1650571 RepID=A0ABW7UN78_9ACTN